MGGTVQLWGGGGQDLPLANLPLFCSDNLDEARERVARVYCDHRLEVVGRGEIHARHNRLSGRHLSINVMTYGAKTLIAPGPLEQFYLFQFPIRGHASVRNGGNDHEIGGGSSGVINPDAETRMIWSEDCAQIMIQVDRHALQQVAQAHFGLPEDGPLRFEGANDLTLGEGRGFAELLFHAVREAERGGAPIGGGSLLAHQFETTLMVGLLQTQRHNIRTSDGALRGAGVPRIVRLAEAYLAENIGAPITLEDIARAVGVSERALQAAFRAHRGRSPMTVLRDLRIEQAWTALSHPAPQTNVTDVAMQLGFFHLGRFAECYRQKYGCTPVETLRLARRQ
jgi:AraC-like DNA-binding protein